MSKTNGEGLNPPVRVNTCPKQTGRDCTLPVHVNMCPNKRGGVEPSPFASICLQNKREGVEPSPFTLIHVQNKWGGLNPPCSRPFVSKRNGEGRTLPFLSKPVKTEQGGGSRPNESKTNQEGSHPARSRPNESKRERLTPFVGHLERTRRGAYPLVMLQFC